MTRLIGYAVVFLCLVSPAYADQIVDIVAKNIAGTDACLASDNCPLNFTLVYDVTAATVLTAPEKLGKYFIDGQAVLGPPNLITLIVCIVHNCDGGFLYYLGPNPPIFPPLPPEDQAFPAVGTYGGSLLSFIGFSGAGVWFGCAAYGESVPGLAVSCKGARQTLASLVRPGVPSRPCPARSPSVHIRWAIVCS